MLGLLIASTDLDTMAPGLNLVCRYHGIIGTLDKLLYSTCALSLPRPGVNMGTCHMRRAGFVNGKEIARHNLAALLVCSPGS